jgi:Leucine-rich repeat (LRR) protein
MVNLREAEIKMMEKRAMVMAVIVSIFAVAVWAHIRNVAFPIRQSEEVPSASPKYEPCPESCRCSRNQTDKSSAVHIDCADQHLSSVPKIIDNDISISILNLSFNNLNNLTLLGYESTTSLYLQYCQLNSIDEKAFYGFKKLTVLDLSYNLLTSIPPNLFATNHLLDTLILRNNDLQDTDPNTPFLMYPSSLRSLDLRSCKLSTLSSATFSSLPNLRHIDISRNEFVLPDPECLHFLLKL